MVRVGIAMTKDILQSDIDFASRLVKVNRRDDEIIAALCKRGLEAAKASQVVRDLRLGVPVKPDLVGLESGLNPHPPAQPETSVDFAVIFGRANPSSFQELKPESSVEHPRARATLIRSVSFELLLVVLIAFGISILHSVYPLFRNPGVSHTPCRLLGVAMSLTFLGYVLCRKRHTHPIDVQVGDPQGQGAVTVFARVGRMTRWIRQVRFLEWCLVGLVALWRPGVALAYRWLWQVDYAGGLSGALTGNFRDVPALLDKTIGLCVLAYVLHRRGSSFSDIGLRWNGVAAALALPLFLLGTLLSMAQWPLVCWLGQTFGASDWHPPDIEAMIFGSGDVSPAMALDSVLNGFFEEVIVRAFVMTEVIKLTQKTWLAVAISVSLQTSYHFYQGVPMALSHVALFTLFALFYAKTRSILPVALAHSLNNLSATWGYGLRRMLPY